MTQIATGVTKREVVDGLRVRLTLDDDVEKPQLYDRPRLQSWLRDSPGIRPSFLPPEDEDEKMVGARGSLAPVSTTQEQADLFSEAMEQAEEEHQTEQRARARAAQRQAEEDLAMSQI